jgi:hypothetical protein
MRKRADGNAKRDAIIFSVAGTRFSFYRHPCFNSPQVKHWRNPVKVKECALTNHVASQKPAAMACVPLCARDSDGRCATTSYRYAMTRAHAWRQANPTDWSVTGKTGVSKTLQSA